MKWDKSLFDKWIRALIVVKEKNPELFLEKMEELFKGALGSEAKGFTPYQKELLLSLIHI